VTDHTPLRLQAVNDALQTVNALLERLLEEFEVDEQDELVRLITGVRGALLEIAAELSGFSRAD